MTEAELMNTLRLELSKYGVVLRLNGGVFRTADGRYISSGLPPGTSDLQLVGHREVAFIEVKTATGRTTQEQEAFLRRMKELGHRAGVVRSVDEALELIGGLSCHSE
jgi:VRR-NUC domain.